MKRIMFFITPVLVIGIVIMIIYFGYTKKTGYVTSLKLFHEFRMKSELESKLKSVQIARQTILDSLKLSLQSMQTFNKVDSKEFSDTRQLLLLKEQQFDQENEVLQTEYTQNIWKQLNQYVQDYGQKHGFDYIYGADSQGAIMYASASEDITKELIQYCNEKYAGK